MNKITNSMKCVKLKNLKNIKDFTYLLPESDQSKKDNFDFVFIYLVFNYSN